jgi:nucleoside-diphosphate-sugar epimerase
MVEALIRLMNSDELYEPVNLGNPIEFTIKQLAEEILKITGSNSTIVYHSLPEDDPKQRKPDISRAQAILGWKPTIQLNEGLRKTIAYFKARSSAGQQAAVST